MDMVVRRTALIRARCSRGRRWTRTARDPEAVAAPDARVPDPARCLSRDEKSPDIFEHSLRKEERLDDTAGLRWALAARSRAAPVALADDALTTSSREDASPDAVRSAASRSSVPLPLTAASAKSSSVAPRRGCTRSGKQLWNMIEEFAKTTGGISSAAGAHAARQDKRQRQRQRRLGGCPCNNAAHLIPPDATWHWVFKKWEVAGWWWGAHVEEKARPLWPRRRIKHKRESALGRLTPLTLSEKRPSFVSHTQYPNTHATPSLST